MNHQRLSANPTSIRSRFAEGFLRALTKINRKASTSNSSPREIIQRYRRVKTAADKSLACAVGSRRAWSRAMLFRIRNQTRNRRKPSFVRRIKHRQVVAKRRNNRNIGLQVEKEINVGGEVGVIGQADELRRLVPGGGAMDFCRLLDEAAHYIQCLNTQVQVMRCIADSYSCT